ncbi:hypothetical protein Zmor_023836 [Zophobas morio]|uniref:Uncharacterized protein n=1 Tax=Zophobas morio TaxID=2755281 RepID=A0AA38I0M1_9CUCU|nr:hypothetical protein Zmor_023836 [Zophobas morio]
MGEGTEEQLRVAIESKMEELFRVKAKVGRAYKVDEVRYIIEMEQWNDKLTILKEKAKLKGRDILIDSELTKTKRAIQKYIRDVGRIEKGKGAKIKVEYQKLNVNGQI